jgi:hypothetical protein
VISSLDLLSLNFTIRIIILTEKQNIDILLNKADKTAGHVTKMTTLTYLFIGVVRTKEKHP